MVKKKKAIDVVPGIPKTEVQPEKKLNSAAWVDEITHGNNSNLCFGRRTGHIVCMRAWAISEFGVEKVAYMSDNDIEREIVEKGYLPIVINGDDDFKDDGVFLIKKEELRKLPCFSR